MDFYLLYIFRTSHVTRSYHIAHQQFPTTTKTYPVLFHSPSKMVLRRTRWRWRFDYARQRNLSALINKSEVSTGFSPTALYLSAVENLLGNPQCPKTFILLLC